MQTTLIVVVPMGNYFCCARGILLTVIALAASTGFAAPQTLQLEQLLKDSDQGSPTLEMARSHLTESQQAVEQSKSGNLPDISLAAIAAEGDPGSMSFLGFDQNLSSKNRSGYGAGLVVKETLYDFGRTSNQIGASEAASSAAAAKVDSERASQHWAIVADFTDCVAETAKQFELANLSKEAEIVARETNRFVQSGQKSLVEKYLADAQASEVKTARDESKARVGSSLNRLAIWTQHPLTSAVCPSFQEAKNQICRSSEGPLEKFERTSQTRELEMLNDRLQAAKSDQWPTITANGSGGWFHNDQLDQTLIYSVGLGLQIPLYDGSRRSGEIAIHQAQVQAAQAGSRALQQKFRLIENRIDQDLGSLHVREESLHDELRIAEKAYALAKSRYFELKGSLQDLREAFKNLTRVRLSANETQAQLTRIDAEKEFLIEPSTGTQPSAR